MTEPASLEQTLARVVSTTIKFALQAPNAQIAALEARVTLLEKLLVDAKDTR